MFADIEVTSNSTLRKRWESVFGIGRIFPWIKVGASLNLDGQCRIRDKYRTISNLFGPNTNLRWRHLLNTVYLNKYKGLLGHGVGPPWASLRSEKDRWKSDIYRRFIQKFNFFGTVGSPKATSSSIILFNFSLVFFTFFSCFRLPSDTFVSSLPLSSINFDKGNEHFYFEKKKVSLAFV